MTEKEQVAVEAAADAEALQEMAAICRQRSATYGLISRMFRVEMDEAFLASMKEMRFPLSTGNEQVDEGYKRIATYLSGVWSGTLTELAVDYCRTFIGTKADAYSAAFPVESVYTSEKRLRMQEARDEMLAIYRANGLDKDESWKDSEDHLAVELEFMQVLCDRAAAALDEGDEDKAFAALVTQRNVMYDHLLAWVPMMVEDMKTFAKTDFYQGLACLTMGFLESDYEFLDDVLVDDAKEDDEYSKYSIS